MLLTIDFTLRIYCLVLAPFQLAAVVEIGFRLLF